MTLVARAYDPLRDARAWDTFVAACRTPHVLFNRGFMEYHGDRFVDASVVVEDLTKPGNLQAVLPASAHGDHVRSHGGLTFGGLLTPTRTGAVRTAELFDVVRAHLAASGFASLRYKPVPWIFHVQPAEDDLYALSQVGAKLTVRDVSSALDLRSQPRWAKGRRSALKHADPALRVMQCDRFAEFISVETEVLKKHGVAPVHTGDELSALHQRFPEEVRLWAAVDSSDELVGGVVTFETPVVVHTQYIGATDEGLRGGAIDLILRRIIDEYSDTHRWLSFGINSVGGTALNPGLAAQKEGFGAGAIVFDQYDVPLC